MGDPDPDPDDGAGKKPVRKQRTRPKANPDGVNGSSQTGKRPKRDAKTRAQTAREVGVRKAEDIADSVKAMTASNQFTKLPKPPSASQTSTSTAQNAPTVSRTVDKADAGNLILGGLAGLVMIFEVIRMFIRRISERKAKKKNGGNR